MWITPYSQDTDFNWPLSIDDKIKIFIEGTMGWQLDIANQLINGEKDGQENTPLQAIKHSGFATLHVVLSYFEMIAKYQAGFARDGRSEHYFKEGVKSVFPQIQKYPQAFIDNSLSTIYKDARCGLYHAGITSSKIILAKDIDVTIGYDEVNRKLIIDPHQLVRDLINHLRGYGRQLIDPANTDIRNNFEKRFDFQYQ